MASIQSITFDQASYAPGDTITLTADYTPDQPGSVPTTFNATVTITDASGAAVANATAPFVVAEPVAGGDVVSVSDDGGRAWSPVSDSGTVAVFTAIA